MARGDLVDVGYGTMASPRTMCCSGFQWRYANTSAEAINTNSDIIEIFPYIMRTATNYTPYSNDLRNSYIQITIGGTTTTQYLKTKYNFGNVSPINTKFSLTSAYDSSNPFGYGTPDSTTYITTRTINSKTAYGARFTVPHNTDGSAPTVSVKWVMVNSSSHSNIEKTASLSLDSIPRTSKPTCANVTLGNAVTINTNRASSSFTHKLEIKMGSTTVQTFNDVGASYSWTPTVATYAPYITTGTTGTATIVCTTYSNGSSIGTAQTTCTLTVPNNSDTKPTVSISVTKGDSVVPSTWGVWVKGKSKLTVTLTGTPKYSTTINSYSSTANGATYTSNSYTTSELTASGSVSATVTDKRGFTSATATSSYTVVDYANPQITTYSVARCTSDGTLSDSGTYVKYSFAGSISSVSSKNAKTFKVRYKQSGGSYSDVYSYTSGYSVNQTNVIFGSGNIDITKEYVFRFEATDSFTTVAQEITVGTVADMLNFNASGKSMAIGGISQRGSSETALDLNLDSYFNKPVKFNEYTMGKTISGGGGTSGYYYVCDITCGGVYSSQFMEFTFLQRNRYGKMILKLGGGGTAGAISSVTAGWIATYDVNTTAYYYLANNKVQLYVKKSEGYDHMDVFVKVGLYEILGDPRTKITWVNTTVTSVPSGSVSIGGCTSRISITGNANYATSATNATNATNNSAGTNLITGYSLAGTKGDSGQTFDAVTGNLKRSGLYSIYVSNIWYNLINVRHRNGEGDGVYYGLQIRSGMQTSSPVTGALEYRLNSGVSSNVNQWSGWYTLLSSQNMGSAMLTLSSDWSFTATAWTNTQVAFSGRSTFTNSNGYLYEQSSNGIKCKVAGWYQVTGTVNTDKSNQFDAVLLKGTTTIAKTVNTGGRCSTVTGIVQVAANDIIYLGFNSNNTSGKIYANTNFVVTRVR